MHQFTAHSPEELKTLAGFLYKEFRDVKIWLLYGEPGAGKTTFTKAFCAELGIAEEEVQSPTFGIVNEYVAHREKLKVFHFDLYRLKREEELLEIGFDEYLDEEAYKIIEWPELAVPFIDENYLILHFEHSNKNERRIFYRLQNLP